jgi:hypothetical protein
MYGSTMIGTLASGVTGDDLRKELEAWTEAHPAPGFISGHILVGDDGTTVVNVAMFEDKDSYMKLADNPDQDKWWSERMAPKLAGEPRWIDGTWVA